MEIEYEVWTSTVRATPRILASRTHRGTQRDVIRLCKNRTIVIVVHVFTRNVFSYLVMNLECNYRVVVV